MIYTSDLASPDQNSALSQIQTLSQKPQLGYCDNKEIRNQLKSSAKNKRNNKEKNPDRKMR